MHIVPFETAYLPEAAGLFVHLFKQLRDRIPEVPSGFADASTVQTRLERFFQSQPGLMALENGRLMGYLGWYIFPGFRDTDRIGAYCPEWAHAACVGHEDRVYRALYRSASDLWTAAGAGVHAISLLAGQLAAQQTWFWSGFGLTVVDAVRPMTPPEVSLAAGLTLRRATPADAGALAVLDAEHAQHYFNAPILMPARAGEDAQAYVDFMQTEPNSAWIAWQGERPVAYMRFEASSEGAADCLAAEDTIAVTAAFTRPEARGQRAALALLSAGLRDYAARGFTRCAVDFESLNPEASAFWTRYFKPVSYSLLRVPERC